MRSVWIISTENEIHGNDLKNQILLEKGIMSALIRNDVSKDQSPKMETNIFLWE